MLVNKLCLHAIMRGQGEHNHEHVSRPRNKPWGGEDTNEFCLPTTKRGEAGNISLCKLEKNNITLVMYLVC